MKALPILVFGMAALVANLLGRGDAATVTADHDHTVAQAPTEAETEASVAHPDDCQGGAEEEVSVKLEVDELVRGRAGERLGLGIHVHAHFEDPAELVGAVEIIDDRGGRIGALQSLEARRVAPKGTTSYRVATPDGLRDGYYRAQASVLVRVGGVERREEMSTRQLYFHVAQGTVTPVTHEEWMTKSQAGLAFQVR
jgi:hypothetical protein